MKKPYVKKIGNFSGFTVWIVDGKYVRDYLDEEFSNFGQPLHFKIIPKKELWIDKEHAGNETRYFIIHMLAENRLMQEGKSFDEAFEKADKIERMERKKSELLKKAIKTIKHKKDIINRIHKKFLKKYSKNLQVWIVNGELVRDLFFIDFTEGGHDKVYSFIPQGEVWLDDDLSVRERKFVLLHEVHERNLMVKGWAYDSRNKSAHFDASNLEYFCRRHPKLLDKKLKEEIENIRT